MKKFILLAIVLVAVAGSLQAYRFYKNSLISQKTLLSAFENIIKAESMHVAIEFPKIAEKPFLNIEALIKADKNKFSSVAITLDGQNQEGDVSQLTFVTQANERYVKPKYSNIDSLEKRASAFYPQYKNLSITKTILDLLEGDLWLKLPTSKDQSTTDINLGQKGSLLQNFKDTLIVRSVKESEDNMEIRLGINQRKLVNAIETIKNSNSGLTLREINAIKNYVQSTDDWNRDLLVIKLNSLTNEISEIQVYLPEDPGVLIKEIGFSNPMRFGGLTGPLITIIPTKIFEVFEKNPDSGLVYVATIRFSEINKVEDFERPENTLEYSEFAKVAQEEVFPIIKDYAEENSPPASQNP